MMICIQRITLLTQDAMLCILQESLRLYPPVGAGQVRLVNQAMQLSSGVSVPSGSLIWIPHHGMHTSGRNWENGKDFIPGVASGDAELPEMLRVQV